MTNEPADNSADSGYDRIDQFGGECCCVFDHVDIIPFGMLISPKKDRIVYKNSKLSLYPTTLNEEVLDFELFIVAQI